MHQTIVSHGQKDHADTFSTPKTFWAEAEAKTCPKYQAYCHKKCLVSNYKDMRRLESQNS